jgi:hypothetical protein
MRLFSVDRFSYKTFGSVVVEKMVMKKLIFLLIYGIWLEVSRFPPCLASSPRYLRLLRTSPLVRLWKKDTAYVEE